jgi:hypothetical protein
MSADPLKLLGVKFFTWIRTHPNHNPKTNERTPIIPDLPFPRINAQPSRLACLCLYHSPCNEPLPIPKTMMFQSRRREPDPIVNHARERSDGSHTFSKRQKEGLWWRVYPSTWREVFAIQMMDNGEEKAVPASGEGVLISNKTLTRLIER